MPEPNLLLASQSPRILPFAACRIRPETVTGLLDLTWRKPWPPKEDAKAFGKAISDRMDFRRYQGDIEVAISTINHADTSIVPSAIRTL
jgi:hypothetical protein